jgi:flagellar motor component MotA
MHEASLLKEMTLEGVIGIVEGLNPTLIRLKMEGYQAAPAKPKKATKPAGAAAPAPAAPAAAGAKR